MVLPCNILRDHFIQNHFVTIWNASCYEFQIKSMLLIPWEPQNWGLRRLVCVYSVMEISSNIIALNTIFMLIIHNFSSRPWNSPPKLQTRIPMFIVHNLPLFYKHITLGQPHTNFFPSLPCSTLPKLPSWYLNPSRCSSQNFEFLWTPVSCMLQPVNKLYHFCLENTSRIWLLLSTFTFWSKPLLSHLFYLILTVCYSLSFHCCSLSVFSQQSNQCDILRHKLCCIFYSTIQHMFSIYL